MEWYTGSIEQAVATAQSDNKIFVVFISDTSPASEQTSAVLEQAATEGSFARCVCLHLRKDDPHTKQFAEIYPVLVLPTLYLINPLDGVPLVVLPRLTGPQQLADAFAKVREQIGQTEAASTSSRASLGSAAGTTTEQTSEDKEISQKTEPSEEAAGSSSSSSAARTTAPSSDDTAVVVSNADENSENSADNVVAEISQDTNTANDVLVEETSEVNVGACTSSAVAVETSESGAVTLDQPETSILTPEAPECGDVTSATPKSGDVAAETPESGDVVAENSESGDVAAGTSSSSAAVAGGSGVAGKESVAERVARAKERLREKQAQAEREAKQKEIDDELARREAGKAIVKRKEELEEREMKESVRQRRKDKEEDRLAKERVQAQIAADRADRLAREALFRAPAATATATAPAPARTIPTVASADGQCRIKFRLPDGSSAVHQFPVDAPLSTVQTHAASVSPLRRFKLASTLRSFTEQDLSASLQDLGLAPAAILLILPLGDSSAVSPRGGSLYDTAVRLVTAPLQVFWTLIGWLLGTAPRPVAAAAPTPTPTSAPAQPPAPSQRETRPKLPGRSSGNIHRLRDSEPSDDESNTYNGNSTQQM